MRGNTSETAQKHNGYYRDVRVAQNKGRISVPGFQYLVHLLRGGYLGDDYKDGRGRKLLDVGCGSGFNAVTMAMMGWDVTGCEISPDIVRHARGSMAEYGYNIPVGVGTNENLPYPDAAFEFLLSMNVIHYAQSYEAIQRSVREYTRVLKQGGRLLMFTISPESWLLKNAEPVSGNMMRVKRDDDYREGELLYVFNDCQELEDEFSPWLTDILTGSNRTDFFTRTLHHWLITGIRNGKSCYNNN